MVLYPFEIGLWLLKFTLTCATKKPMEVAHSLIMLGVVQPGTRDDEDFEDEVLKWFRVDDNQRAYNRRVHKILVSLGMLYKVRRVIREDLKKTSDIGTEYGHIVLKTYGEDLLENFLTKKPNPLWV